MQSIKNGFVHFLLTIEMAANDPKRQKETGKKSKLMCLIYVKIN